MRLVRVRGVVEGGGAVELWMQEEEQILDMREELLNGVSKMLEVSRVLKNEQKRLVNGSQVQGQDALRSLT